MNMVPITRGDNELKSLAHEINVRLSKADDHRLSAALKLAEAKAACKEAGVSFRQWVSAEIKLGYSQAAKLARVGASDDPKAALDDLRKKTVASVRISAANKQSRLTRPLSNLGIPSITERPQRGKAAICARVRGAISALTGLPPPAEVAEFFKGTDDALIVGEQLEAAHSWLNEFASIWESNNAD